MKKLVLIAGAVLLVSLVFPNGISLSQKQVVESGPTDPTIVKLLQNADAADRSRVSGIYDGLAVVVRRDAGKRVKTTEQWAELHGRTLDMAVEQVGKYPGLDVAIDNVFKRTVGTDDVLPTNPDTQQKLITAAETVANSAR